MATPVAQLSTGPLERRYKIFLSSSFEDLKEARSKLILATLRLKHIPTGMELFCAGPPVLTAVEEEIASSDIFAILVGGRLGSRISEDLDALSYTEHEYEFAINHNKPILAFLLDDREYEQARHALPLDSKERDHDEPLRKFRERVKRTKAGGSRIVEFFQGDDAGDLVQKYSTAVHNCVAAFPTASSRGWVPGGEYDQLKKRIMLDPAVADNPFFQQFARQLSAFGTISQRTRIRAHLKLAVARYFWKRYFPRLEECGIQYIHFESGSSVAYVSHVFIESIRLSSWFYTSGMQNRLHLRTNNLLTYLDFLVQDPPWQPIDILLQPFGCFCPDEYGGTYGVLNLAIPEAAPGPGDPVRARLRGDSQERVDELRSDMSRDFDDHGLVLMTASGLDTRPEAPDAPYPGPHVGSYQNMLFKRCLLSLACPKVLFLDQHKIGYNFCFNNCHPVCDASFPWESIKESTPLAIALAVETNSDQVECANRLAELGFAHIDLEEPAARKRGPLSIIAANRRFGEHFRGRG